MIDAIVRIARFLNLREFVVAFFLMAFAGAIPNLFVGISSAIHGIPQLSFGDIVGGNVIDLTIAVALATLIAKGLPTETKMVQISSIVTILVAALPILLILDGTLGRGDGMILILIFLLYTFWLFSKKERFSKVCNGKEGSLIKNFKVFISDIGRVAIGIILLLVAAEGIVKSASFFADTLNLSLALIGIVVVGLGNALPEVYFAILSAKRKKTWMILGNLTGSVIVSSTLVLGIVALICPIKIIDFSPFSTARFFLIAAAAFFLLFVRTGRKISKKEAIFLLAIYLLFIFFELLFK